VIKPTNFRTSTLKEREEFYSSEFSIKNVSKWFRKNALPFPQIFAVDMGTETGIIKDKGKKGKIINFRSVNLTKKLLNYLPEDLYYDRNQYSDPELILKTLDFRNIWKSNNFLGQQLAFDIDADNIKCACRDKLPKLCEKCFSKVVEDAVQLAELLGKKFDNIGLVYSGRGMHVHVFDKRAFRLSISEREQLNKQAKKFAIDPWVSRGYIRLMRLPYSLNSLVSRIAMPLSLKEAEGFNPFNNKRIIPKFLG
jgi:DNA primase catalytic subunit